MKDLICFFVCIDVCIGGIKATKDKTADALTHIKAEASKCIVVTVFFTTRHSQLKKKKLVSPKNVLDKSVKSIKFLKSWLLSAHLFNILCDKIAIKHEVFLLHIEEQRTTRVIELWAEIAAFYLWNTIFTWKNDWQTNYSYSRVYLAVTFMEVNFNKESLLIQGKQWIIFVTMVKFKFLSKN